MGPPPGYSSKHSILRFTYHRGKATTAGIRGLASPITAPMYSPPLDPPCLGASAMRFRALRQLNEGGLSTATGKSQAKAATRRLDVIDSNALVVVCDRAGAACIPNGRRAGRPRA
jgi:hypothetical protein